MGTWTFGRSQPKRILLIAAFSIYLIQILYEHIINQIFNFAILLWNLKQ